MSDVNVYAEVHQAFQSHLRNFQAGAYVDRIQFDNNHFDPPLAEAWLRTMVHFNDPVLIGAFTNGVYRQRGLFQISVMYPHGEGSVVPHDLASRICAHFKRGTVLTQGLRKVRIERVYVAPAVSDQVWYQVPVTAEFWCYSSYQPE